MKKIIAAALALTMVIGNGTALNVNAEETPLKNLSYYDWGHPVDYEKQPHIEGFYSGSYKGCYYISVVFLTNLEENYPDGWNPNDFGGYKYKLQMKVQGKWKNICSKKADFDGDSVDIINLTPYTTYTVRIYIPHYGDYWYNKGGWKAYSEAIKVRTEPAKTKIRSAASSKNAVRLNWKKVRCAGYKIQQYDSKYKIWKNVKTIRNSETTTTRIPNLRSGTKYRFRIKTYGKTLKKYPALENDPDPIQEPHYTHNLWGKPSKAVTIRTKK